MEKEGKLNTIKHKLGIQENLPSSLVGSMFLTVKVELNPSLKCKKSQKTNNLKMLGAFC